MFGTGYAFLRRDAVLARYMLWHPCLSVRLSHVNTGLHKQHFTIAQGLYCSDDNDAGEIPMVLPPSVTPRSVG